MQDIVPQKIHYSLQETSWVDTITPVDIYHCYVHDFDADKLQDSSSSGTKRQVNAFIMSCPITHHTLFISVQ